MSDSHFCERDLADLAWAYQHLEHPSLAARLSSVIGVPIEQALSVLPQAWHRRIEQAAERSIGIMLDLTIHSMATVQPDAANDPLHRLLVMGTGAAGGFFGPLALLAELPLTTALMLRSIADIAHSQGEDLASPDAKLACMQVFALGGRSAEDRATDTGYYGLRVTLSLHFAPRLLPFGRAAGESVPAAVNVARCIAARFGLLVSDKVAAQLAPVAGAAAGALLNVAFMRHFQDIARGHFIVRRLERRHGADATREAYEDIGRRQAQVTRSYSPLEGW
ncbi:MAG: EcsC family protein [Candidatus Methylumidiphilus sp.]